MSSTKASLEEAKRAEAMQPAQSPSAPPLENASAQQNASPSAPLVQNEAMQRQEDPSMPPQGPPPTYSEAMSSSPYPPPSPPTAASQSSPYPITSSSSPTPYPLDGQIAPTTTSSSTPRAIGFNAPTAASYRGYPQPIVDQPSSYDEAYVQHPKTTYVVLREDGRDRNRRSDADDCSDCLMLCVCCLECCRCIMAMADCLKS